MYIDTDEESSAQHAGLELGKSVQQTVIWPQEVRFPQSIVEYYPSTVPPLRADRDTVIIGKIESRGPQTLTMKAEANHKTVEWTWDLVAERSNEDFAFLPTLVDLARGQWWRDAADRWLGWTERGGPRALCRVAGSVHDRRDS